MRVREALFGNRLVVVHGAGRLRVEREGRTAGSSPSHNGRGRTRRRGRATGRANFMVGLKGFAWPEPRPATRGSESGTAEHRNILKHLVVYMRRGIDYLETRPGHRRQEDRVLEQQLLRGRRCVGGGGYAKTSVNYLGHFSDGESPGASRSRSLRFGGRSMTPPAPGS